MPGNRRKNTSKGKIKMEVRESFILHTEWIEDLPEEYKNTFLSYIYHYGARGQEPKLEGLEKTLWTKIKRRMDEDQEKWETTKIKRSAAGKAGAQKRWSQTGYYGGYTTEEPAPAEKRKRFVKPTIEEVRKYCAERKNNVDPQTFINYYESNGWKVSKNPMKDWKAAVRNWEIRQRQYEKPAGLPEDKLIL